MSTKARHWARCKDVTFTFRRHGGVRIEIDNEGMGLFMARELNTEQWAAVLLEDSIAKRAYEATATDRPAIDPAWQPCVVCGQHVLTACALCGRVACEAHHHGPAECPEMETARG